jgi:thymidylate kinase
MLLEVIGIPGSGKSTLIKALKQDPELRSVFNTWQGIRVEAIRTFLTAKETRQKQWVAFPWNMLWSMPRLNDYVANCIFHRFIKHSPIIFEGLWGTLAEYLVEKVSHRTDIGSELKPYYINCELEKMAIAKVASQYSKNYHVKIILDEGVLTAINSLNIIPDLLKPTLLPDAVLFVNTKPSVALKGIRQREERGRINKSQQKKSDNEILAYISEKHKKYISLIEKLRHANVPILEFNYENDSFQKIVNELKAILSND